MTRPALRFELTHSYDTAAAQEALCETLLRGQIPQPGDWLSQLSNASLTSHNTALLALMSNCTDPVTAFLADWAGFWAFGPAWKSPIPYHPLEGPLWVDDQAWMMYRRQVSPLERRASTGTIDLDFATGPLRINAAINGTIGHFILDTGAPSTVVAPEFGKRAALRETCLSRDAFDGAGNRGTLRTAIAATVTAGTWHGQDIPMDILELEDALGIDGILSPFDLFGHQTLVFDGPAERLHIGGAEAGKAIPVVWSEGTPSVRAKINDADLFLLLDTGAGGTVVLRDALGKPDFSSPTAIGTAEISRLPETVVLLDGQPPFLGPVFAKARPPFRPRPLPRCVDGYLGTPWFSQHCVTFPKQRGTALIALERTAND
jgi:hypothetical protein